MGLMDILSGGMNLLDLPASMIRDTLGGANPFDQLASPFQYENRLDGRDVLENWGLLGQNQEGFDLGDVAGFAADVVMDPFTIGALGRKIAGAGTKAAAKAFGKNVATDAAASAPMMAGAYGINPQTQWSLPGAAGAGDAVNAAIGLPQAIQGPMTPWAAMGHNRKVQQMLDAGAMPAEVARLTRAKTVDPSLYDHLIGSPTGSADHDMLNKLRSDWEGSPGINPDVLSPARLYHGTASNYFPDIDMDVTSPGNLAGRGFYMTSSNVIADSYVNKGRPWAMERRRMSPSLVRSKLQDFMQANPGIAIDESVPVGNTLARFLSGDLALDEFQTRAMAGRMFGEPAYGNISDIERMFDMTPVKPDQGWLKVSDSSDPLAVHSAKSDMENLFKDSVEVITPSGYHVQKRMLDTRNPLDLDAIYPNPDGLGPEMQLEEISKSLGFNHKFQDSTESIDELAQKIFETTQANGPPKLRLGEGVSLNPRLFGNVSKNEIKDSISNLIRDDNPSAWADRIVNRQVRQAKVAHTPQMLDKIRDMPLRKAYGVIEANMAKLQKVQSSVFPDGARPSLDTHFIGVSDNVSEIKDVFIAAEEALPRHMRNIDNVSFSLKLADSGKKSLSQAIGDYATNNPSMLDVPEGLAETVENIAKTAPDVSQGEMITKAFSQFGVPLGEADPAAVREYVTMFRRLNGSFDLDPFISSQVDRKIRLAVQSLDPDRFIEDAASYASRVGEQIITDGSYGSYQSQGPINAALAAMRGDDLSGWDVFNYLNSAEFGNTHTLFQNLGYDALTHTGGQRSGNGDMLHRVFVGLDPDKIYKGHSIAPDPVDVWTLQNVLTGMPAMPVPARAMWAESRSAPGM